MQYIILRKDLIPSKKDLEKLFEEIKRKGLDLKVEIKKLVELGYIREEKENTQEQ